jgi:FKBP-type peptidyl-prolyl cis-trans isomerase
MRSCCVWILGGLIGMSFVGCEDPGEIVPTTPPGASLPRVSPDPDPAQAQGEMPAPSSTTAESAPLKVTEYASAPSTAKGETKMTAHGVKYETLKEGTGAELKPGQSGKFLYEGKLEDGTVFDSTAAGKQPRIFRIGVGELTKGWEEAIPGMKAGETRKLTVPPELGYGKSGRPPKIPPNATLIFEVELVQIL